MSTVPGAFVPVAPPADGLRLAFAAARRRRNRKAGAAGAAGLLAAVALLASTGGTGDRTLLQEPLPPASTGGLGVLTGTGVAPAPGGPAKITTFAAVVDPAAATARGFASRNGSVGRLGSGGRPGEASRGRLSAARSKPISGQLTRGTGYLYTGNGDLMCPARKQQERQRGLCTDVYANPGSSSGTMSMTAEVCNVGTAPEILSYDTARELDLTVRRSGIEIWRWSIGRHFAATPHDIPIGTEQCVQWTTNWAQVDSHGVPVRAGSYDVVADFDADEVAAPDRHPSSPCTVSSQP